VRAELPPPWFIRGGVLPPRPPQERGRPRIVAWGADDSEPAAPTPAGAGWPISLGGFQVREARGAEEVAAAGRVTVAANAEFAPTDPDSPFQASWARYLKEMADAAGRAAEAQLLVAVDDDGRVLGTVTLYLAPGSMQWRPEDAMFRLLAVDPAARGRGVGRALMLECLARARAAGKRRMALHTTAWMTTAKGMYERAGFQREPEGDVHLPGVEIIAYAAEL
jgi:GNAT superfamily N-acetyltransferase